MGLMMATNGKRRLRRPARSGTVAALDVGSTKVCCFIGAIDGEGGITVTGIGHHVSHGVRGGTIVDVEAAGEAISSAVQSAEQMAGETVRDILVNVSGGRPSSHLTEVVVPVCDHVVGETDLHKALMLSRNELRGGERDLIHALPVAYTLDGSNGIRDPRGMVGDRLSVTMHLVTAQTTPVRNLHACVGRCHLDVESHVASAYASALACLVEDEMELGVTCIDIGGGTTSIAMFLEGALIFTDMIPIGGGHVTNDIARGLNTPLAHAERIKILFGTALASDADERELLDVPQVGEEDRREANHIPKSALVGIIRPRLEEIFELVRARLTESGFDQCAGPRVVLTGGTSQLPGMRELAQRMLDKQVRLGRPLHVKGLAEATGGPAFATAAGLLHYAVRPSGEVAPLAGSLSLPTGFWGKVGMWLREYL